MFGSVAPRKTTNAPRTQKTITDCAAATSFVPTRFSTSITTSTRVMNRLSQLELAFSPTNSAVA